MEKGAEATAEQTMPNAPPAAAVETMEKGAEATAEQTMPSAPPAGASGVVWMPRPVGIPDCPPGLEYLTLIDRLMVNQAIDFLEVFTAMETAKQFRVENSVGQQVYYAAEESGCCARLFFGIRREFIMHITDNAGQEVMQVKRPFKCFAGNPWCANIDCMADIISVEAPVGTTIGYIRQGCSFIKPRFEIQDAEENVLMMLQGPLCVWQCGCDVEFQVVTPDGQVIGDVTKVWSGVAKEFFTNADHFGINFPLDLSVKVKALLMAAVFLINMMFFERKN